MKAFVITLRGNDYSEACAERCIASGARHGIDVLVFNAVDKAAAESALAQEGLWWTWPRAAPDVCPHTGLKRHVYKTADRRARIGCAMSHYMLWKVCVGADEPIMILEHDTVFLRGLPELPGKFGAIMLNNPDGATPKGRWWKQQIEAKRPGVHEKTVVFTDGRPDGLAGNSAYIISPRAALACMDAYRMFGVWPNDATLCRQLVPGLMEVYPFVTEVRQTQSTSGGY
jgi:GR25 family glycosyltransferase involved in LPS biosynthesis